MNIKHIIFVTIHTLLDCKMRYYITPPNVTGPWDSPIFLHSLTQEKLLTSVPKPFTIFEYLGDNFTQ